MQSVNGVTIEVNLSHSSGLDYNNPLQSDIDAFARALYKFLKDLGGIRTITHVGSTRLFINSASGTTWDVLYGMVRFYSYQYYSDSIADNSVARMRFIFEEYGNTRTLDFGIWGEKFLYNANGLLQSGVIVSKSAKYTYSTVTE